MQLPNGNLVAVVVSFLSLGAAREAVPEHTTEGLLRDLHPDRNHDRLVDLSLSFAGNTKSTLYGLTQLLEVLKGRVSLLLYCYIFFGMETTCLIYIFK